MRDDSHVDELVVALLSVAPANDTTAERDRSTALATLEAAFVAESGAVLGADAELQPTTPRPAATTPRSVRRWWRSTPRRRAIVIAFAVISLLIAGAATAATVAKLFGEDDTAVEHTDEIRTRTEPSVTALPAILDRPGIGPAGDRGPFDESVAILPETATDGLSIRRDGLEVDVWLAARADGGVCGAWRIVHASGQESAGDSCVSGFSLERPVAGGMTTGEAWEVRGIAADEVTRIDVEVDGRRVAAELGTNAYFASGAGRDVPDALIVTLVDGTVVRIDPEMASAPEDG